MKKIIRKLVEILSSKKLFYILMLLTIVLGITSMYLNWYLSKIGG